MPEVSGKSGDDPPLPPPLPLPPPPFSLPPFTPLPQNEGAGVKPRLKGLAATKPAVAGPPSPPSPDCSSMSLA